METIGYLILCAFSLNGGDATLKCRYIFNRKKRKCFVDLRWRLYGKNDFANERKMTVWIPYNILWMLWYGVWGMSFANACIESMIFVNLSPKVNCHRQSISFDSIVVAFCVWRFPWQIFVTIRIQFTTKKSNFYCHRRSFDWSIDGVANVWQRISFNFSRRPCTQVLTHFE